MTRRGLFATVAAAIAGRKIAPALTVGFDRAVSPSRTVVRYTSVKYGLGFKVERALIESDAFSGPFYPGKVFPVAAELDRILVSVPDGFRAFDAHSGARLKPGCRYISLRLESIDPAPKDPAQSPHTASSARGRDLPSPA